MHKLNYRNQPLALTDCLMRYRVSTFHWTRQNLNLIPYISLSRNLRNSWSSQTSTMSFSRPEKLITRNFQRGNSSTLKLQRWCIFESMPGFPSVRFTVRIFVFIRFYKILGSNFEGFSLYDSIKSLQQTDFQDYGKSVYLTDKTETAWIHWPGMDNSTTLEIPFVNGSIFHVQISQNRTKHTVSFWSHHLPATPGGRAVREWQTRNKNDSQRKHLYSGNLELLTNSRIILNRFRLLRQIYVSRISEF